MPRDDTVYLHHILDAIAKVEEYIQDLRETDFQSSTLIQDAVIRQLEIIDVGVDIEKVRKTAQDDIPRLKRSIHPPV